MSKPATRPVGRGETHSEVRREEIGAMPTADARLVVIDAAEPRIVNNLFCPHEITL